jgi:flavin reductase
MKVHDVPADSGHAANISRAQLRDQASVDVTMFKSVMRKLAGTVAVIAVTDEDGKSHGLTATAVCSVSVDPPMILIVVNRSSRTHHHIDYQKAFSVNILAEEQSGIADLFASKTEDQFSKVSHLSVAQSPAIAEAAAYVRCCVEAQFDVATHTIFIGRVIDSCVSDDRPLIYQDAKYCRIDNAQ